MKCEFHKDALIHKNRGGFSTWDQSIWRKMKEKLPERKKDPIKLLIQLQFYPVNNCNFVTPPVIYFLADSHSTYSKIISCQLSKEQKNSWQYTTGHVSSLYQLIRLYTCVLKNGLIKQDTRH